MKKVDVTTLEGAILWQGYIRLTQALADVVQKGPLENKLGHPLDSVIITIKVWPYNQLSFQVQVTDEGKLELWNLGDV